jgi:diguanylate cyclase (GGDEF)-like protein
MKSSRVPGVFGAYPLITAGILVCALSVLMFAGPADVLFPAAVSELVLLALVAWAARRQLRDKLAKAEESAERWRLRSERLTETATEDETSGVGNARQFESEWWRFLARYERRSELFSVALLELGDALRVSQPLSAHVIGKVGQILATAARTEDSVCRIGPQTFGVLLSGTPGPGADRFVERVRIELSSHPFHDEGHTVYATVYGGVAEWEPELVSIDRMLARAEGDLERFGTECRWQGSFFAPDPSPEISAPAKASAAPDDEQQSPHQAA